MGGTRIIIHGLPTARRQAPPAATRVSTAASDPRVIHQRSATCARLPLRRFILPACLLFVVFGCAVLSPTQRARAATPVPFAPGHAYVTIADRPVCSLLGSDGNGAKVEAQDGSAS